MKKQAFLSQTKYVEHRGVTKGYIGRLIKEGNLKNMIGIYVSKHKLSCLWKNQAILCQLAGIGKLEEV